MTLATDPVLAAALSAAGTANNPFLAHVNFGAAATASTATGTELAAAANAADPATYNFWAATPNGSDIAELRFVFAADATLDFVGIAAHNLGTLGATVTLQYSTNSGSSWTNSAAGAVTPVDNAAIGFRFEPVVCDYWRLRITDAASDVVIGVALLSEELMFPERIYREYDPVLTPTEVDLQSNVSEGGHLLGSSVVRRSSTTAARFRRLPPSFLRAADWLAFQRAFNSGAPLFWAWRPDKYAGDLYYAWREGGALRPSATPTLDLMAAQINMRLYDEP